MKRLSILALIIVNLSACSLLPTRVQKVSVPFAIPCVQQMPTKPQLISDAELLQLTGGSFVYALHADRLKRIGYEDELQALLTSCTFTLEGLPQ